MSDKKKLTKDQYNAACAEVEQYGNIYKNTKAYIKVEKAKETQPTLLAQAKILDKEFDGNNKSINYFA